MGVGRGGLFLNLSLTTEGGKKRKHTKLRNSDENLTVTNTGMNHRSSALYRGS